MKNQSQIIIDSLKDQLKLRGLSYKDLGLKWDLSESSVKRVMTSDKIDLSRIESACSLMDLQVAEFFKQVPYDKKSNLIYLTNEQEARLAKDPEALHYFLLIQEGRLVSEIIRVYSITAEKNIKILNQLERWGLIELHPHHKIKRLYLGQLRFKKEGPLGRQLERIAKTEFLDANFEKEANYFTFLHLNLKPGDALKIRLKFTEIFRELVAESETSISHPNFEDYGIMMALRPWQPPFTQVLVKRKKNS